MKSPTPKPCELLLVEDNEADALIARYAVRETGIACNLRHVKDGVEALEYLRQEDGYTDAVTPDLILLDINMPRMNGWELLDEVRGDRKLRRIPVVMLTTSRQQTDVDRAYDLLANSFVSKPIDYDDFTRALQGLLRYWLNVVRLPARLER